MPLVSFVLLWHWSWGSCEWTEVLLLLRSWRARVYQVLRHHEWQVVDGEGLSALHADPSMRYLQKIEDHRIAMNRTNIPASSSTSAVRYSRIAEVYTAAFAPMRTLCCVRCLRYRWIRPTGNYMHRWIQRLSWDDVFSKNMIRHTCNPAFWLLVWIDRCWFCVVAPWAAPAFDFPPDFAAGAIGLTGVVQWTVRDLEYE
jgi:hypothetical protein